MGKLGGVFIEVRAPRAALDKDFNGMKGATSEFDQVSKQTADRVKGYYVAVGLAIAAAAAASLLLVKKSIEAASDLEETTGKFNVVFKGQEAAAKAMTDQLVAGYAMSTEEARRYLSSIQDLLVPMGMNATEAAKMSGQVAKLSADLGSFNNLPTEQVMLDMQSALVGNFETMKKYGVVLNVTNVTQRAMAMGLAETAKQLTAADKAQAAFALITEGSAAAVGDLARTSESFANQQKQVGANWKEMLAIIGTEFLPMATKLTSSLVSVTKTVMENKDTIYAWGNVGKQVFAAITTAFLKVSKFFALGYLSMRQGFQDLIIFYTQPFFIDIFKSWSKYVFEVERSFANAFLGIRKAGQTMVIFLFDQFDKLFIKLRELLAPLDAIFKGLVKTGALGSNPFDGIQQSLSRAASTVKQVGADFDQEIININQGFDDAIKNVDSWDTGIKVFGESAKTVSNQITDDFIAVNGAYDGAIKLVDDWAVGTGNVAVQTNAAKTAVAAVTPVVTSVTKATETMFDSFGKGWSEATKSQTTWAESSAQLGKDTANNIKDAMGEDLFNVLKGDFDNIGKSWESVTDGILSNFADTVASMIIEGEDLGDIFSNIPDSVANLGTLGTVAGAVTSGDGRKGAGSLAGAGIGFLAGGPVGGLVGSQIGSALGGLFGGKGGVVASLKSFMEKATSDIQELEQVTADAIGGGLLAGLSTGSFVDFKIGLKEQIFNQVLDGVVSAVTQSKIFTNAIDPIVGNIQQGLDDSFKDGVFDETKFNDRILPLVGQLDGAISNLEPVFDAISGALGGFRELMFPEKDINDSLNFEKWSKETNATIIDGNALLDDIDLSLGSLSDTISGGNDMVASKIDELIGVTGTIADRPVNVTVINDFDSLDKRIDNVVVEREERGLTAGERTASL